MKRGRGLTPLAPRSDAEDGLPQDRPLAVVRRSTGCRCDEWPAGVGRGDSSAVATPAVTDLLRAYIRPSPRAVHALLTFSILATDIALQSQRPPARLSSVVYDGFPLPPAARAGPKRICVRINKYNSGCATAGLGAMSWGDKSC